MVFLQQARLRRYCPPTGRPASTCRTGKRLREDTAANIGRVSYAGYLLGSHLESGRYANLRGLSDITRHPVTAKSPTPYLGDINTGIRSISNALPSSSAMNSCGVMGAFRPTHQAIFPKERRHGRTICAWQAARGSCWRCSHAYLQRAGTSSCHVVSNAGCCGSVFPPPACGSSRQETSGQVSMTLAQGMFAIRC